MRALPVLVATVLAAAAGLTACGSDNNNKSGNSSTPAPKSTQAPSGQITKNPANSKVSLKIGSKNFTEQRVLGEIGRASCRERV